ncbi:hypothetical protein BD309DRAFT_876321 [Dichomitus squalens]|nr:hypothetical protein BD309DRAFT_876321 [Dichomitus squalens]
MPRRNKAHMAAAARAQAGLARARQAAQMEAQAQQTSMDPLSQDAITSESESSHDRFEDADPPESLRDLAVGDPPVAVSSPEDAGQGDVSGEESVEELEGDELLDNLEVQAKSAYVGLMELKSRLQWARAESELRGVRTGGAARTVRKHRQNEQSKEMSDAIIRNL